MKRTSIVLGAVLAGLALSAPASARNTPVRSSEVWQDIVQLEQDVDRADARDTISEREAAGLRGQIRDLKKLYKRYNANGLSPAEARTVEQRIDRLRQRLRNERHDRDHHRG